MKKKNSKDGFALLLVLGAGIAIFFLIVVISQMGQGVKHQITVFNRKHQAFLIANFAYSKTMGELYSKPWSQRLFKDQPLSESLSVGEGKYDLFVENTPDCQLMVDLYIRVTLQKKTSLFFWRCQYNDDLLDFSQNSFFGEFSPDYFPQPGTASRPIAEKVKKMLQERKDNESIANEVCKEIAKAPSLAETASILGGKLGSGEQPKTGVPPALIFSSKPVAAPTQEVKETVDKNSKFEIIAKFYQTYLGRGPDVEGAAYWLKEHPEIQTPEDLAALCQNNPGLVGRRACIEKMNLQMPQDNTRAVFYEMAIHYHWLKHPELPAPGSRQGSLTWTIDEFAEAAVAYARQLPPMPASFVVKDLYFEDEWKAWLDQIE